MRNIRTVLWIAALALAAALFGAACGPSTSEVSVGMTEFAFSPSSSSVTSGSDVTLSLTNNGTVEHNWVLMEAGYQVTTPFDAEDQANVVVETSVDAGKSASFVFTAPSEAGTYQVVCSIPGHLEAGMAGSLSVQ